MSIKSATKRMACIVTASLILTVGSVQTGVVNCDDVFDAVLISAKAGDYSYEYYPKCSQNKTSIVDGLNEIGVNSSYSNREKIAKKNNIKNYSGTADQNSNLLKLLKEGKLIKLVKEATPKTIIEGYLYYPKCSQNKTSIVDGLVQIGVNSSYSNRAKIAKKNNIKNYSGTAPQNREMLNLLKKGKLRKI